MRSAIIVEFVGVRLVLLWWLNCGDQAGAPVVNVISHLKGNQKSIQGAFFQRVTTTEVTNEKQKQKYNFHSVDHRVELRRGR